MRLVPRLGLLGATFALPLGAVLASHVFSEEPAPPAPVEVRIGESDDQRGIARPSVRPSTPPSPVAVRPPVAGQVSASTQPQPQVERTLPAPVSDTAVPAPPPVADDDDDADEDDDGRSRAKGVGRSRGAANRATTGDDG